jgi:hypothetical protein
MKFGRLTDLVKNAKKALSVDRAFFYAFKDKSIQEYAIILNTDDQLFNEGVDRNGEIVGYYGRKTEELNKGKTFAGKQKIAEEKYFFYDTGSLFNSFSFSISEDGFTITATDVEKLESVMQDPDMLVGLTQESETALALEVLPLIREYIIKTLLK